MLVNEGTEREAVLPTPVEVLDFHIVVAQRLVCAPQLEGILATHTFHADLVDLELGDDGPKQAQDDLLVAVKHIHGTNVGEPQPLLRHEFEGRLQVLSLVDLHLRVLPVFTHGLAA